MPRPRQAQGRPGTVVIPEDWGSNHAIVVDKTHLSSVVIGQAGSGAAWNNATKQTEATAVAPAYSGPATLMLLDSQSDRAVSVVDDPTSSRVYEVGLSYAASAVQVGHVVTVGAGDPDPMLATKALRVEAIERGSRRFSRVLLAVLLD